ncbi:cell filamentation protein Fic [Mixta theicola]|uniref:protein adenylyltransferase n=1 Tax=Mixta theicola TaxID=1458355 RepID=A0A2K1QA36_9GAMM|nr:putative adenosine monophosphate-protein transferase Fic [Mixta theicola]PNS11903.1 cell filamentation protein Fic [Mixta theicola]GLR07834.1 cell filamentation protein Fic [Mixta theicola]
MAANVMNGRDPYYWQNDDVLRNRLDLHDTAQLQKAEVAFTSLRAATIELGPPSLGFPSLCAIHRTLFQDLYDWAGEIRKIDLYLGDTPFCHFEYIEKEGNALMEALEEENGLADLPVEQFVARLAHYYCEINMLHPFRDGNGRAQRLFFEQLIIHAGYDIDWSKTEREAWLRANEESVRGDLQGLTDIFTNVVSEPK